ncbi:hypothetical protein CXK93_12075 [Stutzerimonas decontaminans]|uniref:Uncharacterized protein n=2 Tax=Stutzerimonas TaxID=2901164 RepID=A0ABX4VYR5_9GAMM|nr:hypothetical protein [Stutzerimonas decontaminans]AHY43480.1 hypothetical protein UIB01_13745 [Stutzerimonas decontaminans]MCQ4245607.1 hypothetical protein [Stutzerimonas decontaminans]PNF85003.1 hypothetical protein CXK93_12075 [Stutzerimonas decontaminans]
MKKPKLTTILLLTAVSTAALAQQQEMSLQQEREQMGADLEENRQQIGRDINRIREPGATQNDAQGINRGGVQSDADNPRPNVPGTANPPAGTGLPSAQDNVQQPNRDLGTPPAPGATQPQATPGGANGNVGQDGVTPPGGIGTGSGNGAGGASSGGAATGGATGGAAGR